MRKPSHTCDRRCRFAQHCAPLHSFLEVQFGRNRELRIDLVIWVSELDGEDAVDRQRRRPQGLRPVDGRQLLRRRGQRRHHQGSGRRREAEQLSGRRQLAAALGLRGEA